MIERDHLDASASAETNLAPRDLSVESSGDLLRLYGDILVELRRRDVIRTENSPVGDVAELLAARAFDLTLATNSSIGYDDLDRAGLRYQIMRRDLGLLLLQGSQRP